MVTYEYDDWDWHEDEEEQAEQPAPQWSVTDDFVDPNRQPAGDQEPW